MKTSDGIMCFTGNNLWKRSNDKNMIKVIILYYTIFYIKRRIVD